MCVQLFKRLFGKFGQLCSVLFVRTVSGQRRQHGMLCNGSNSGHRLKVQLYQQVLQLQQSILIILVAIYDHGDCLCAAAVYCLQLFPCIGRDSSGENRKCDNDQVVRGKWSDGLLEAMWLNLSRKCMGEQKAAF